MHAWYDEPGGLHPFDRTTKCRPRRTTSTWTASIPGRPPCATKRPGRLEAGPLARQMVAGGKPRRGLAALRSAGPRHVQEARRRQRDAAPLRPHARGREALPPGRGQCLREFRLNDPWYIKPTEKDGKGWGATEAIRGALCHWIDVQGRQDQELPDHRADDLERRTALRRRHPRADGRGADRRADRRSARSRRSRPRLPLLRFLPRLHRARARCQDGQGAGPLPHGLSGRLARSGGLHDLEARMIWRLG